MFENYKQLERLQNAKASFDVTKWEKEEVKRKKLVDNIKQFPEKPIAELMKKPPVSRRVKRQGSVNAVGGL